MQEKIQLVNADSLEFIKTLPSESIDLIATDPPYFRVKSDLWDRQWKSDADYLIWIESFISECKRVLNKNGSIYIFCGARLAADVEIITRKYFKVLNVITWAKAVGVWKRNRIEAQRKFFNSNEKIIFAEHLNFNDFATETAAGSEWSVTMKPIIDYFQKAKNGVGLKISDINKLTNSHMAKHWFTSSQFEMMSKTRYEEMKLRFQQKAKELNVKSLLTREYEDIRNQYEELREEYKNNRRFFSASKSRPFLDVWNFDPAIPRAGKHPCEKPVDMLEHIIQTSSKDNDLVADFFMGSGSTIKAAKKLNRRALGVELDLEYFEKAKKQIEAF